MNFALLFLTTLFVHCTWAKIYQFSLQSVRGEMKLKNFHPLRGYRLNVLPRETLQVENEIKCIASCIRNKECFSLNVWRISATLYACELLNTSKFRDLQNLTSDDAFVHWFLQDPCSPSPCGNLACVANSEGTDVTCRACPEPGYIGSDCKTPMYDPDLNYALNKPTTQKSFVERSGRAVDGNKNRFWQGGSCTGTDDKDRSPQWWRVDFEEEIQVARVFITNRADCCGYRLSDFAIKIGNSLASEGLSNPKCAGDHLSVGNGQTKMFVCSPPMKGQYLVIQSYRDDVLTICELEAFAYP